MDVNGSVLIYDDDEKTTYFLEQILIKRGKYSGEEFLKMWNKSMQPVRLKFQLLNLNLHEAFKRIIQQDPSAVVVIVTGNPNENLLVGSLRYGSFNYIKKNYCFDYLLTTGDWPRNKKVLKSFVRKMMMLIPEVAITKELLVGFYRLQVISIKPALQYELQPELTVNDIKKTVLEMPLSTAQATIKAYSTVILQYRYLLYVTRRILYHLNTLIRKKLWIGNCSNIFRRNLCLTQ